MGGSLHKNSLACTKIRFLAIKGNLLITVGKKDIMSRGLSHKVGPLQSSYLDCRLAASHTVRSKSNRNHRYSPMVIRQKITSKYVIEPLKVFNRLTPKKFYLQLFI